MIPGEIPDPGSLFALDLGLIVQDRIQQRTMDFNLHIVVDEAKLAEFVHEEADAGPGRADHFGQGFQADIGNEVADYPACQNSPTEAAVAPIVFRWN